jgi:serine protease Do
VDADGRLLGINTNRIGDGFYLAIPTDAGLRDRIDRLAAGHSPTRRRLGIAVAPSFVAQRLRRSVGLPERDGVLVRGVDDGSPAAAGGVTTGDLIVSANGVAVHDTDDLWAVLDALGGGDEDTVDLGIVRGAEELTIRVTFASGATATEEGSA